MLTCAYSQTLVAIVPAEPISEIYFSILVALFLKLQSFWQLPQWYVSSPSKEVGLLDVGGGVAVTTVSVLVVEAALPQHQLILWDRLLPAEWVESNGAVGFFVVR